MPDDRRAAGLSSGGPSSPDVGRRDPLPGRALASRLALAGAECEEARPDDLRAILAHELAHARNHDLAWNLAAHVASILLWFHPLAWRIRAAMRRRVTPSAMPWPPTCSATWPRTAGRSRGWPCGRRGRRRPTGWPWPELPMSAPASMP